ncbi:MULTISPECIES: hypothetical protein [Stenotrophomonas]|uniref:hypothetical protein n=1 Tax=Stenotrophomonas pavanii TaxID=487698 RepID=UPI0012AEEB60|nr:hypothetical protein FEO90_05460 [Stenotrophomonas maltophilia]
MNSSRGERKCALMVATLAASDRRQVLAQLPPAAASRIKRLVRELQALRLPIAELAQVLLADEVVGLTSETSLDVEQLMGLAAHLPDAWYARVLAAWGELDRSFCVSLLEPSRGAVVARELGRVPALPPRLAHALKAEAMQLAAVERAA